MNLQTTNTNKITEQVIQKIGNPVSVMVVKATLESFGIRNKDVITDFGFANLKNLASHIYEDLKNRDSSELLNQKEQKKSNFEDKRIPVSAYLWIKAKLLFKYYPLGLFHLFPVFLQVVTIIFFGYSLWTFSDFNIMQSTVVVFGVIMGLIISGGYVQVLGRQASFYWHHKEYSKSKIVINKLIRSGIYGICIVFLVLGAINFFFNLYPFSFIAITFVYALLIGALLLVSAPFHTIKRRWVISLAILIASLSSLGLMFYTNIHIYITHWLGILIAILICKLFLFYFFRKYKNVEDEEILPKRLIVIYRNYAYFFYGGLIYLFIFMDRILAWSADIELTRQYIFLYEKDYEIGMDLAILIFFLLAGVLEYAIASFSKFLDIRQKSTFYKDVTLFNKKFHRMYWGHIALLFLSTLLASAVLYLIITQPWGYERGFGEALNVLSIKVCIVGGLGYFFLTWGMLNALYLFTLNRPHIALRALFIACIVNFAVGFLLSRTVSYEYSVFGMLIGAVVFMILTLRENYKFFKNLDYYYYAAY